MSAAMWFTYTTDAILRATEERNAKWRAALLASGWTVIDEPWSLT